jgi:hypothetical protein
MSFTTDPTDKELGHGVDEEPIEQHKKYLILSDEERSKGFVRPVRKTYIHVGATGPNKNNLRDLTEEQKEIYSDCEYIKFEEYPQSESSAIGRYWTQKQLDEAGKGCQQSTTMSLELAETYARNPHFYGSTYCANCKMHKQVGKDGEFVWEDGERVGT